MSESYRHPEALHEMKSRRNCALLVVSDHPTSAVWHLWFSPDHLSEDSKSLARGFRTYEDARLGLVGSKPPGNQPCKRDLSITGPGLD